MFGGLRAVRELQRGRRRSRGSRPSGSDVDMLAELTYLPAGMWAGVFWLIAGVAVTTAAWILLLL